MLTPTLTFTPIPVYIVIGGKVAIAQEVCHFGPGVPYRYKYGIYQSNNLEISTASRPPVKDEKGCAELSHGRVIAAEKHGYTVGTAQL